MKVKLLKSGLFAHPQPHKGNFCFVEGETEIVDDLFAKRLIETKWAEVAKDEPVKEKVVEKSKPKSVKKKERK